MRSAAPLSRTGYFFIALAVFFADQVTKAVVERLPERGMYDVIPHLFRIVHVENYGAAFGLFQESPAPWKNFFLILFSLAALVVVFVLLWRNRQSRSAGIALALIFGGACGNLFDRLLHGSVVDFLLFYLGPHEWPAFNLADSAIVAGACLLVWEILHADSSQGIASAPASAPAAWISSTENEDPPR